MNYNYEDEINARGESTSSPPEDTSSFVTGADRPAQSDFRTAPNVGPTPDTGIPPDVGTTPSVGVASSSAQTPYREEYDTVIIDKTVPYSVAPSTAAQQEWQEAMYREVAPENQYTPSGNSSYYRAVRGGGVQQRETPKPTPPARRPRGRFLRAFCLILACAIASAGSTAAILKYALELGLAPEPSAVNVVLGSTPTPADTTNPLEATIAIDQSGDRLPATAIYQIAVNQVVSVSTTIQGRSSMFGGSSGSTVYGSGFIVSEDGYILTNHHVVADAIDSDADLHVTMRDGTTYTATIVGYEADNDVAVIKIDATGLSPVKIGSNQAMLVGETIYAVGNPRRLDFTMTNGIVSALDREVEVDGERSILMFQISAAVNSGNSGGPVYNDRGEVLGIVSAKYASSGTEGLGFAIPIDDAMQIATDLITNGYVTGKAQLGITGRTVDPVTADYYDMVVGVFVNSVAPGSCAEIAGIERGDIIIALGDNEVSSLETLQSAKREFKAGDTTTIEVFRNGDTRTFDITFDEERAVTD